MDINNVQTTDLKPEQIDQLRAIEFVSSDSKPAEASKILYSESHLKDCEVSETDPLIYFTTTDGEKISPDEIVTSQSLIECIGKDEYWEEGKCPVIWAKRDPLSAPTMTFIFLDSKGKFHYVGDLSTAKNELSDVFPLCKDELEAEMKVGIKIKTAAARSNLANQGCKISPNFSSKDLIGIVSTKESKLEFCKEFLRKGMWPYALYFVKTRTAAPGLLFGDAYLYGSCFLVKYLVEKCDYNPDQKKYAALLEASKYGRLSTVKYLVGAISADRYGYGTALHFACSNGHLDLVKYLIEKCHCNPEAKDYVGWTPLYFASKEGHLDIVQYLVEECHVTITKEIINDVKKQEIKNYLIKQWEEQKRNQNQ